MRATLGLIATVGTIVIAALSVFLAVTIMRPAIGVRQGVEPVVYLVRTLAAQAEALASAEHDVRGLLAGRGPVDRARLGAMRARLLKMTAQVHASGYEKVPPSLRSALAGADADVTRLEDRLLESLDLVGIGSIDAARQRMLAADSLQITIRRGLVDAERRGTIDLVEREAELRRAAWLAMWIAGLLAAGGLVLSGFYLVTLRRRVDVPLEELGRALERVKQGDLATQLPVRRTDELGRLAEHFNATTQAMAVVRRRDEEALRRSETSYRALVEEASYGIFRSTPAGRFLMVNPALVAMLGYDSAEQILALDLARDVYEAAPERERLMQSLPATADVAWKRRDGDRIVVHLAIRRLQTPEGEDYFEGIAEDVTERHTLEDQLRQAQKMEAVGRLAGGVAHDFNNLLTAITGYTDLLRDNLDATDPRRSDVEQIGAAARRAADLTRQLLAFSRKQVLQPRVLDLNGVLRSLGPMLQRLIGEDVSLQVVAAEGLGAVRADPGQIEQVVINLAVNARDAMPNGGRLRIETADVDLDEDHAEAAGVAPGRYVRLSVADTGVGMSAETRSHIFEPFYTTKGLGHGTGLGLATVYGIVKQSGGHVSVASEVGRGTTFVLHLPRLEQAAAGEGAPAPPTLSRGTETVLLAEDETAVREVIVEVLTRAGYRVLHASDGAQALETARSHAEPIELLLTDVVMPGMSGRELAEAVAATRPGLRVLYMSGYTDDTVLRHAAMDDGVPFIQKPFSPTALASKIREVLDRS